MAKAVFRFILMSPTKVRRMANLVRGLPVSEAEPLLVNLPHRAGTVILKTLKSATANAENNEGADRDDLVIKEIFVDEGPRMRRFLPRARGRADLIRKRTAHLTIVVEPIEEAEPAPRAKKQRKQGRRRT